MKIMLPAEITIVFENAGEAARWLAGYLDDRPRPPGEFRYPSDTYEQRRTLDAAEAEAIRVLAAQSCLPVPGVTAPAAKVDPQHAAPTYVSGSSDRVYLISEMPTRYIRNVLGMDHYRQGNGLRARLMAELKSRGESWAG